MTPLPAPASQKGARPSSVYGLSVPKTASAAAWTSALVARVSGRITSSTGRRAKSLRPLRRPPLRSSSSWIALIASSGAWLPRSATCSAHTTSVIVWPRCGLSSPASVTPSPAFWLGSLVSWR